MGDGGFDAGPGHAIVLVAIHISSMRFHSFFPPILYFFFFLQSIKVSYPWSFLRGHQGSPLQLMDGWMVGWLDGPLGIQTPYSIFCHQRNTLSNSANGLIDCFYFYLVYMQIDIHIHSNGIFVFKPNRLLQKNVFLIKMSQIATSCGFHLIVDLKTSPGKE